MNPYLSHIKAALPRLLALFDTDAASPTFGMGDRYRWAWRLIDFGNATFQGAAHGLARLCAAGLLPEWLPEASAVRRIEAMIEGARRVTRPDGSCEEAFPREGSFCVTALAAYDLLSAVEVLGGRLPGGARRAAIEAVRPMIAFLHASDETHAFISNHLATAAAALLKWHAETGEGGEARGGEILSRILSRQSAEGWYLEYEGADPGYQTLAMHYLADIRRLRPDIAELSESLRRAAGFLQYFAHPDGTFGGCYGSRNTRFYYPGGIEALAGEIPEAAALASFMRPSVADMRAVGLPAMDEPNLIPMFNSYCLAAQMCAEGERANAPAAPAIPALSPVAWRKVFPEAGLLVENRPEGCTVVSLHKGGALVHASKAGRGGVVDAGAAFRDGRGRLFTTQGHNAANAVEIHGDTVTVTSDLTAAHHDLPAPWQFAALRVLSETAFRFPALREAVKRRLVSMLITGRRALGVKNVRTVTFSDPPRIEDALVGPRRLVSTLTRLSTREFRHIHMASSGYWQRGDDER